MRIAFSKSPRPFFYEGEVPGDKSITHRALLLGAIAKGRTVIRRPLRAADTLATLGLIRALGVQVDEGDEGWVVHGGTEVSRDLGIIDCGNSGTTMRLGAGLLVGLGVRATLAGDASLSRRPMERIVKPLRLMGGCIVSHGGRAPLTLGPREGELRGIRYRLPVASAQVKSSLLLAGLWAKEEVAVREPLLSRDHTERLLRYMGADLEESWSPYGEHQVLLKPHQAQELTGKAISVPGDPSSAAPLAVLTALLPGARLVLRHVGLNPTRGGFWKVLQRAGVEVRFQEVRDEAGEPVGTVEVVGPEELRSFSVDSEEVPHLLDEVPVLAVLALKAKGVSSFYGLSELRVKESDRVRAIREELGKMGGAIEERGDDLFIKGGRFLRGARVSSRGDHRLAMMLSLAAFLARGEVEIEGAEALSVSFPSFRDVLREMVEEAGGVLEVYG
ncbi:MAG: 3-phosphoshikimate 1-carboxyvinyltransferase [Clostridiales bacterium]|nr:3-phosphoshikimate 1-carboxyvinyltransferase [Clostridiales bacterium]